MDNPTEVVFDGESLWVANNGSSTVTKLKASDGSLVGTFTVGSAPFGIAFDGANIWAGNVGGRSVTILRASDGLNLGTIALTGGSPVSLVFDGSHLWIATNVGKLFKR